MTGPLIRVFGGAPVRFRAAAYVARYVPYSDVEVIAYKLNQYKDLPIVKALNYTGQQKAHDFVAALAKDGATVIKTAKVVIGEAEKLRQRSGSIYVSDLPLGHKYVAYTKSYEVPEWLRAWYATLGNHNPFRLMLGCFPPFGREIPRDLLQTVLALPPTDEPQDMTKFYEMVLRQEGQIVTFGSDAWQRNLLVDGPAELGRSSIIHLSDYTEIEDDEVVLRYAVASTDAVHVFSGRVLWVQVYNKRTGKVSYFGVGGGGNAEPLFNGFNCVFSGVVFGGMLGNLHYVMRAMDKTGGPVPMPSEEVMQKAMEMIYAEDLRLFRINQVGAGLDLLGIAPAVVRSAFTSAPLPLRNFVLGVDEVTGPPTKKD